MQEYELNVLEQYDIEVISTRKTQGCCFMRYRQRAVAA